MSVSEAKVFFLVFWSVAMVDLKQQRDRVCACLETIKTNSSACYQSSSDMGRQIRFNHDIFFWAMVLLIIFFSKTWINFIYVIITYVYVTEFR